MASDNELKTTIIAKATGLFSRFGLEKTTMEDIAKAAGKGKSTLYYYFKSKEDVFADVIRMEIAGLKTAIIHAMEKEDDPYGKFMSFVGARLDYLNEKADQYIAIKDEHLKHYRFIRRLTSEYSDWEISTIKDMVIYGRNKGLFLVTDAAAVSQAIFFALKGLEYPWITNLTKDEIRMSVNTLVDILLKGISKK
ncbi:MAG: helix-turn-helix transcriptional regulator [Deltaproteobacteria bacterium]|nr:helix-turn-helix transcriptional regulator [Deltaproteobacteria bacterium]